MDHYFKIYLKDKNVFLTCLIGIKDIKLKDQLQNLYNILETDNVLCIHKYQKTLIKYLLYIKENNKDLYKSNMLHLKNIYDKEELFDVYCNISDDLNVKFYYSKIKKFKNGINNILEITGFNF